VARADLGDALRGGLLGVALGEALGLPWAGVSPRAIRRDRLLEGVGATGAATAAVLGGPPSLTTALAVGWRHRDHAAARRAAALELGFAAVVVADLAAATLAGKAVYQLVTDHADDWPPPFRGVGADDRSVLDALLAVLHRHDDPSEAMRAAVRLGGGGTAVLGALVGGILGCRRPTAIDRVPWRDRVALPGEATLAAAVATLTDA
jgi:ADP-ribosylglycohydrolase